jgi:hypothetical protein
MSDSISTKIDDGGPAFPVVNPGTYASPGMTMRDWFAGQALCGIMSGSSRTNFEMVSKEAYKLADAMLNHREKTQ